MYNNDLQFYPTPSSLIYKMLKDIDFRTIKTVLEPSAGSGSLVEAVTEKFKAQYNSYNRNDIKFDIDCIEIDENLRYILQGKGFRVIHDNFLTYDNFKSYDLIVANYPFAEGDKHLLKSLDIIKQGGQIVAILNAETLRNPYSNSRKELVAKLEEYNATIEYLQEEFSDAERRTEVEVAMVKVNIPKTNKESILINNLKQEEQQRQKSNVQGNSSSLIDSDFIKAIITQYQFEIKAGLNFINEYENLKPLIMRDIKQDNYTHSILSLSVDDSKYDKTNDNLVNAFIKRVRYKYWTALFSNEQFTSKLTSNLLNDYRNKITELKDYDFSYYNIKELQLQMSKNIVKGVEDTILALFEEFSYKHSYFAETSSNIHYYNGWKTNKAWKISRRIIIPLSAYSWLNSLDYGYKVYDKLKDIEHVFDYLDSGKTEDLTLRTQLDNAYNEHRTKNIITKYFNITFYKKGTCHITFLDEDLLKKFNIFGCQRKNFLPPSYGKSTYKNMSKEEQEIINNFEGEPSYNEVIKDTKYYMYNPSSVLMIG